MPEAGNFFRNLFFQRSGLGATTSRNDRSRTCGPWKSCQDQLGGEIWEIEEVAGLGLSSHFFAERFYGEPKGHFEMISLSRPSCFPWVRRQCVPSYFQISDSWKPHSNEAKLPICLWLCKDFLLPKKHAKPMDQCVYPTRSISLLFRGFFFGSGHCRSPAPSEMETASSPSLGDLGPLAPPADFAQQRLSKMVHLDWRWEIVTPGLLVACWEWYPFGTCRGCPDIKRQRWFGSVLVNYPSFIFSFTKSAGSKC